MPLSYFFSLAFYLFLSIGCAVIATDFKIKWWEALFLALFFTPWIAIVCIYFTGKTK